MDDIIKIISLGIVELSLLNLIESVGTYKVDIKKNIELDTVQHFQTNMMVNVSE